MALYSLNNQRPAPLPFRITLPGGFTRTDPATFTPEEIAAAGFSGPYTEPTYDPTTQELDWVNGSYVVLEKAPSPPNPDWSRFKASLLTNQEANVAISTAFSVAPGATMTIPASIMSASSGDWSDFRAAWLVLRRKNLIPQEILNAVTALAIDCNLPRDFISFLGGQITPPLAESIGQEWISPDGQLWKVVQARNADGTFAVDDPTTTEKESMIWVKVIDETQ